MDTNTTVTMMSETNINVDCGHCIRPEDRCSDESDRNCYRPDNVIDLCCEECGQPFDDNPGKGICKTCADWLVTQLNACVECDDPKPLYVIDGRNYCRQCYSMQP